MTNQEWECPNEGKDDDPDRYLDGHQFFTRKRNQTQEITMLKNGREWAMGVPLITDEYWITLPTCIKCGMTAVPVPPDPKPANREDRAIGGHNPE